MTFKVYTVLPSSPQESLPISQIFYRNGRVIAVNLLIVIFLICYTLVGGLVFLHFEANFARFLKEKHLLTRRDCIQRLLRLVPVSSLSSLFSPFFLFRFGNLLRNQSDSQIAFIITHNCLQEEEETFRHEWNYKTAALYGFGILTTLGEYRDKREGMDCL